MRYPPLHAYTGRPCPVEMPTLTIPTVCVGNHEGGGAVRVRVLILGGRDALAQRWLSALRAGGFEAHLAEDPILEGVLGAAADCTRTWSCLTCAR